ncbi:hypothetical protein G5714_014010 [Onychostoma macrolepis]|uniref:Uncharacterized protein n=1 Tax=Onychostoma macrolepis TaxID=369639 RepID=A0A7J6CBJ2_9TELE|nr:hypothetical protein G5714_014010 [Onychostoma macrolepis]
MLLTENSGLLFLQRHREILRGDRGLKHVSSSVLFPALLSPTQRPTPSPCPSAPAGTSAGRVASTSLPLLFRSESFTRDDIIVVCQSQKAVGLLSQHRLQPCQQSACSTLSPSITDERGSAVVTPCIERPALRGLRLFAAR